MASTSNGDSSPNTWLWQNPELADVSFSIVFTSQESCSSTATHQTAQRKQPPRKAAKISPLSPTHPTSSKPQDPVAPVPASKQYMLHSQVISSGSAYLRASLISSVGAAKRKRDSNQDACRWHIHAEMDAGDAGAVEAVLRYLYTLRLVEGTTGPELLKIMQVSDLWQAAGPADAASKLLCLNTSSFPITSVYSLPEVLRLSSAFAPVMAAAETSLLAAFDNAPAIIKSPPLLQRFLHLPHSALLALLQSPGLCTDSEESVLLLVSAWREAATGQACSDEQMDTLNSYIRYGRLSRPYLTILCDVLQLPKLKREHITELWAFYTLPERFVWSTESALNPVPWYLPARPTPTAHESCKLQLVVTKAQLKQLLALLSVADANLSIKSKAMYADGFVWTLALAVENGKLWCAVAAHGLLSVQDLDTCVDFVHGNICDFNIFLQAADPFQLNSSECMPISSEGAGTCMSGPDGDYKDSAQLTWWEEYIVDGCVRLTAEICPVIFTAR